MLATSAANEHRLTQEEERRAELYEHCEDRDSFRAAHLLARVCGRRVGICVERLAVVQRCDKCGGPHGVPRFESAPDVRVSLSHTRGAVIAAVSSMAIGVDIESARVLDPTSIARVLLPSEVEWLRHNPEDAVRLWCRKEAFVKAAEVGLAGMASVDSLVERGWVEESSDGFHRCLFTSIAWADVERLR